MAVDTRTQAIVSTLLPALVAAIQANDPRVADLTAQLAAANTTITDNAQAVEDGIHALTPAPAPAS